MCKKLNTSAVNVLLDKGVCPNEGIEKAGLYPAGFLFISLTLKFRKHPNFLIHG
jgi:hypothetical protein